MRLGLLTVALMAAPAAWAFDPAHVERLMADKHCFDCDLTAAELAGATVARTSLGPAILCRTTLPDGSVGNAGCP